MWKLLFVAHWVSQLPLVLVAGFLCRQYPSTFFISRSSFIRLFLMVEIKLLKTDKARTQLTTNRIKIKTCWKLFGMMSFLWHSAPWFCCHWQKVNYSNSSGYKVCLNWIFLWVLQKQLFMVLQELKWGIFPRGKFKRSCATSRLGHRPVITFCILLLSSLAMCQDRTLLVTILSTREVSMG